MKRIYNGEVYNFYKNGERKGSARFAILDLTGQVFDYLTVLDFDGIKNNMAYWKCKCKCGKVFSVSSHELRTGNTKSCGCKRVEDFIKNNTKHNATVHRKLYDTYNGMIFRCYNPKANNYAVYGGRGIRICSEWYNGKDHSLIWNFINWSYENGYYDQDPDTPKNCILTIDRIDNNGPYAPWNCRWVMQTDQCANKSTNRFIQVHDKCYTFAQFAKAYNLPDRRWVSYKIKHGWSIQEIYYQATHPELELRRYALDGTLRDQNKFIRIIKNDPEVKFISYEEFNELRRKSKEA